jgi:hypothetical protein
VREIGYKGNKKIRLCSLLKVYLKKWGHEEFLYQCLKKNHRKDEEGKYLTPALWPCAESDDGVFPVWVVSHLRGASAVGVNIRERSRFFEHFL